jgi:sugar/nucleoside kinase (ribokinase family)
VLCTIGDLVEDVVVWLNADLNIGSDADAVVQRTRGGSAANVAMFAAQTGAPSIFIGQVGHDVLGTQLITSLETAGVRVCATVEGHTGSIVVLVHPNGERTFLTDRGVASQFSHFDPDFLRGATILHIPSYSLAQEPLATTCLRYLDVARNNKVLISIDASSTSILDHYGVVRYTTLISTLQPDVFLCNIDEAALLDVGPHRAMPGAALTVIKQGPSPVITITSNLDVIEVFVKPVATITDTTGAGDAFAAGFLSTFASSQEIVPSVLHGINVASRVLQQPGATLL